MRGFWLLLVSVPLMAMVYGVDYLALRGRRLSVPAVGAALVAHP